MSRTDAMNPPEPHEILQSAIETKFEELGEEMKVYAATNSFDSWHKCINILPEISDLVNCLYQEAQIYEGKHPLN